MVGAAAEGPWVRTLKEPGIEGATVATGGLANTVGAKQQMSLMLLTRSLLCGIYLDLASTQAAGVTGSAAVFTAVRLTAQSAAVRVGTTASSLLTRIFTVLVNKDGMAPHANAAKSSGQRNVLPLGIPIDLLSKQRNHIRQCSEMRDWSAKFLARLTRKFYRYVWSAAET